MEWAMNLSEQRAKLVHDWRTILDKAEAESRALNTEERVVVERIEKDIDDLKATIDARAKLEAADRAIVPDSQRTIEKSPTANTAAEYSRGFWTAMRSGIITPEYRALTVGTDTAGGHTVPDEFKSQLIVALDQANVMRTIGCTVFTTNSGVMKIPVLSTHASATNTSEGGAYSESEPVFSEVSLDAYKYAVLCKTSKELLRDSSFDIAGLLAREFGRALGRSEEADFVNGDGSGNAQGVVGGSSLGTTAAATNAITADELMDTFYSLNRAYRQNATWLMHDSTIKAIRKLVTGVSGDKTYLWSPGLAAGEPDMLLGRPVVASQDMPEIATAKKVAVFGDFSYYYIGDRAGIEVQRLNELYAANGHVGFVADKRTDGKVAVSAAFKHLITHA